MFGFVNLNIGVTEITIHTSGKTPLTIDFKNQSKGVT